VLPSVRRVLGVFTMSEVSLISNSETIANLLFVAPGLMPAHDLFLYGLSPCGRRYDETAYVPMPEWRRASNAECAELLGQSAEATLYHLELSLAAKASLFGLPAAGYDLDLAEALECELDAFAKKVLVSDDTDEVGLAGCNHHTRTFRSETGRYTTTAVNGELLGLHVDAPCQLRMMFNRGVSPRAYYFSSMSSHFLRKHGFDVTDLRSIIYHPNDPVTERAVSRRTEALSMITNQPVFILLLPPGHGWATAQPDLIIHDGCTILGEVDEVFEVVVN
jgi:hypothetical protein